VATVWQTRNLYHTLHNFMIISEFSQDDKQLLCSNKRYVLRAAPCQLKSCQLLHTRTKDHT